MDLRAADGGGPWTNRPPARILTGLEHRFPPALLLLGLGLLPAAPSPGRAAEGPRGPRAALHAVVQSLGGRARLKSVRSLVETGRAKVGEESGSYVTRWTPAAVRTDTALDCGATLTEVESAWPWTRWYDAIVRRSRRPAGSLRRPPAEENPPLEPLELARWLASNPGAARSVSRVGGELRFRLAKRGVRPFELRIRGGYPSRLSFEDEDGPVAAEYSDFREADGLRFPHYYTISYGTHTEVYSVSSLAVDRPLPSGIFEPAGPERTPAAESVSMPLTAESHGWFAPGRLSQDGGDGYFLIDSGASGIVIAEELAPPSVPRCAAATPLHGSGFGGAQGSLIRLPELRLGSATLTGLWVHTLPGTALAGLTRLGHRRVLGILGRDFFDRFAVEIDPGAGRLTLHPPGSAPEKAAFEWLPLDFDDDQPHAEARAGRRKGVFLLDTGAARTSLARGFAKAAQIAPLDRPSGPGEFRGLHAAGPGAAAFPVPAELGPLRVEELRADLPAESDAWPDGVIGRDLLRNAVTWWDYRGGRLGVRPLPPKEQVLDGRYLRELDGARELLYGKKDGAGAMRRLELIEARHPGKYEPLRLKAEALTLLGRGEDAPGVFFREFLRKGDNTALRFEFVLYLASSKRYGLFTEREELLLRHPDFRNDRLLLGLAAASRLAAGRGEEARPWAQKAADLFPWDPDLRALLRQVGPPPL